MQENPACPICEASAWEVVGTRVFRRAEPAESPYVALRLRVLFELWAEGRDVVELRWALCGSCGFVTYLPKASAAEIDAKYRFLSTHEQGQERRSAISALDRRRSAELLAILEPHLPKPPRPATLLDFGGGNGALSTAFAERGLQCFVLDYVTSTVPGVTRLGSTLDELAPGRAFDVVVCSNVIEHVAEPLTTARRLRSVVADGGVVLISVPVELRGGPPKMSEPATHVSFFCESSMATLLTRAGLHVEMLRTGRRTSHAGSPSHAVLAVGRRDDAKPVEVRLSGAGEARQRMQGRGLGGVVADAVSWWRSR